MLRKSMLRSTDVNILLKRPMQRQSTSDDWDVVIVLFVNVVNLLFGGEC
jgi:hypothetical protein